MKEPGVFMEKIEREERINLDDPANWDIPLFPVSVAAQAALISPDTLRQWIVRKRVKLWEPIGPSGGSYGRPAEGEGKAALMTLRAVLHIAAAARLVSKGVEVVDAYGAAAHWVHFGDGVSYWGDKSPAEVAELQNAARPPMGLYPAPAWTFLIHHSGSDARVVRARPGEAGLAFAVADLFASGGPTFSPPTIVFLNKVDEYARGVCEGYLRPNKSHPSPA